MSPGHVERKLFFIADISVDVHELQSARWRKVHISAFDNLDVSVGVLKGHGFLSIINLFNECFKMCLR